MPITKEVQDNSRENQLLKLFDPDLKGRDGPDRDPKAPPDAIHTPTGQPVELKSTTKHDKSVSTAHIFTRGHLERMRARHLIIVDGINLDSGFVIQRVFYANPPVHLGQWLNARTAECEEHDRDIEHMLACSDFDPAKKDRLRRKLKWSKNDPCIPWSMVTQCEEIYGDYANELRRLIAYYPPLLMTPSLRSSNNLFSFV